MRAGGRTVRGTGGGTCWSAAGAASGARAAAPVGPPLVFTARALGLSLSASHAYVRRTLVRWRPALPLSLHATSPFLSLGQGKAQRLAGASSGHGRFFPSPASVRQYECSGSENGYWVLGAGAAGPRRAGDRFFRGVYRARFFALSFARYFKFRRISFLSFLTTGERSGVISCGPVRSMGAQRQIGRNVPVSRANVLEPTGTPREAKGSRAGQWLRVCNSSHAGSEPAGSEPQGERVSGGATLRGASVVLGCKRARLVSLGWKYKRGLSLGDASHVAQH